MVRDQFPSGSIVWGEGDDFLRGQLSSQAIFRWESIQGAINQGTIIRGAIIRVEIFLGSNCPRTVDDVLILGGTK